jgi:uncharacterized protein
LSLYLDTSVLVAIFAKEATAIDLVNLLRRETTSMAIVSVWSVTEFAAATSFKYNQGSIDATLRDAARTNFLSAQKTLFTIAPVEASDFSRAANFANNSKLRLRGGDALHLGIAARVNLPLLTLDKRMKAAAQMLGVGVVDFN